MGFVAVGESDGRFLNGEVSEWLIEPVSKTGVRLLADRGFESRPLRCAAYFEGWWDSNPQKVWEKDFPTSSG